MLRGLDFFKIPPELRPTGLVVQARVREKYNSIFQQATQLIEAVETDIVNSLRPDDTGVAASTLYVCRPQGKEICLKVWDPLSSSQTEYWEEFYPTEEAPEDVIVADPWFSNLLKHAAEGCGFRASVKRVRTEWQPGYCTCLNISVRVPGATFQAV